MRIVHAADSFAPDIGGIEHQVEALARRQQDQGHDVTVITAVADPADLDLDVARAARGRWLTVAFPWRNYRMVADVLERAPVDVVHAHFTVVSPLAIYVTRAASRRGIPVAVTVHSLWWKVAVATRIATLPFGWGRMSAAWSGVSSVAAHHVGRTLSHVKEVSVVPNLVDIQWWQPDETARPTDAEEIRLILVGRLKKRKHVGEFIDVLAQVRARISADTKVKVDIVGRGPRRKDLQRQVERLGLADWVTLLGHREPTEVRRLLHQSDLFIASSRQESFGIAALEARAAGLPVVGYRGNGLSDFIADGIEGVLVADAADLVEALVSILGRPDELGRLRKITMNSPPSIGVEEAMGSVADLYRRARAMHPVPEVTVPR
ncbi:MAG: glycosyltransferase family 4 protein [Actinomycetota bacterium]|nr:glycosyltransferase family 4 protein [Actinomycetota bacterium]